MTSWSLRRRLNLAFAGIGILLVLLSAVAVLALVQVQRNQQEVTGTVFRSVTRSGDLLTSLLDQETGLRGYALSGDISFLSPYLDGQAQEGRALADLHGLLAGHPDVAARLDRVVALVDDWRASTAAPLIQRVQAGDRISPSELDESRARFDAIRTAYGAYRTHLLAVRSDAYDQMRQATLILFAVITVLVALIIAVGVLLWATSRRWVTGPLDMLGSEVRVVTGGELSHEIAVAGPEEVSSLAAEVDSMRRRVFVAYAEALEARAATQEALAIVEEQKADLERSNTELEQFAYVASHDLQEPLRKVASFCQLLEKRYADQLDERGHQYIEFAVDGAKRMQALINDLLAFSRVGRVSEGLVDVDLEVVLTATLRNLEALIEETGATVTHEPLPTLPGEPALLAALLQNLIGNGMKFRGEAPPLVHIGVERRGEMWEISCTDNGIGIDPKYAEKIFVIFQRLHGRDEYSGTGIGLALSRKIVEYHGGRIWLDQEAAGAGHGGTTFRFTLPAAAGPHVDAVEGSGEISAAAPGAARVRTSDPQGAME